MYPFLADLAAKSSAAISCYPNAGATQSALVTGFDLEPPDMARYLGEFAAGGLINIAGGCCGNTPSTSPHRQSARGPPAPRLHAQRAPRPRATSARQLPLAAPNVAAAEREPDRPAPLILGSMPFTPANGVYMMLGERTNVAGSPKFAKLIKDGNTRSAVSVARQQVENGAKRHRYLHG